MLGTIIEEERLSFCKSKNIHKILQVLIDYKVTVFKNKELEKWRKGKRYKKRKKQERRRKKK